MAQGYVIQTNAGFRLFSSLKSAAEYDGGRLEGGGYETPLAVCREDHYRGRIGRRGILFTDCDQSSRQFSAMIANR